MAKGRGIKMPSEEEVPGGPHRRLLAEVFHMYRLANRPVLRAIVAQASRMDLDGTASQETIRRFLKGSVVPERWDTMWAIYAPLCAIANVDPDALYEEDREYDSEEITHRGELMRHWNAAVDGDWPSIHRTKVEPRNAPPQGGFGGSSFSDEPPF
ncbi:hypothetical protein AB0J28_20405 [Streptosporangium canum]|uniref:hypothetical protein n=1 Tax=Streptosporangium canum TaxID=324952 RepID=UPI003444FA83